MGASSLGLAVGTGAGALRRGSANTGFEQRAHDRMNDIEYCCGCQRRKDRSPATPIATGFLDWSESVVRRQSRRITRVETTRPVVSTLIR